DETNLFGHLVAGQLPGAVGFQLLGQHLRVAALRTSLQLDDRAYALPKSLVRDTEYRDSRDGRMADQYALDFSRIYVGAAANNQVILPTADKEPSGPVE